MHVCSGSFANLTGFASISLLVLGLLPAAGEAACPSALEFGPYGVTAVVGSGAASIAIGDFDGDAVDDVVFETGGLAYVVFGSPDDRPGAPVRIPSLNFVTEFEGLPDHDGDGRDELAVIHGYPLSAETIEIIGCLPDREFVALGTIPSHPAGYSEMAAEDFDGDGDVDLACLRGSEVCMLAQLGAWTFAVSNVPGLSGTAVSQLRMGDFDGNGRNDLSALVGSTSCTIAVFPPSGMNATIGSTVTPGTVHRLAVADIDGDGRDDLVLSANQPASHGGDGVTPGDGIAGMLNHVDPFVYVYRVVGTAATLRATLPCEFNLLLTEAGDIDHDGFVDILHGYNGDPKLQWFRGRGLFEFDPVTPIPGAGRPKFMSWGDLDRDGVADAVMSSVTSSGLHGYLSGPPFVSALDCVATPLGPEEVVLADLDGDGDRDFAVLGTLSSTIARYLGDGSGSNWVRVDLPVEASPRDLVAVDCDADGATDLLTLHTAVPQLVVRRGDGAGGYHPPVSYAVPAGPLKTLSADLDHDGDLDLLVLAGAPSPMRLFLGDGDGGFAPLPDIPLGYGIADALLRDVDGDGWSDLVFTQSIGGVWLARGVSTGESFSPAIELDLGGTMVEVLDANRDGRLDIAAAGSEPNGYVILGLADGGFSPPSAFRTGLETRALRAGDFDGDGFHDLVSVAQSMSGTASTGTLYLHHGLGDGSFAPAGARGVGANPMSFALGDVTGDQRPDVVVSQRDDQSVLVAANLFSGPVSVPAGPRASSLVARVAPSPAFGSFGVELTGLPDAAVRIEVFAVDGRRVGPVREVRLGTDGRGRIAMSAGTHPGVYLVRAAQGDDVSVARAIVFP